MGQGSILSEKGRIKHTMIVAFPSFSVVAAVAEQEIGISPNCNNNSGAIVASSPLLVPL